MLVLLLKFLSKMLINNILHVFFFTQFLTLPILLYVKVAVNTISC